MKVVRWYSLALLVLCLTHTSEQTSTTSSSGGDITTPDKSTVPVTTELRTTLNSTGPSNTASREPDRATTSTSSSTVTDGNTTSMPSDKDLSVTTENGKRVCPQNAATANIVILVLICVAAVLSALLVLLCVCLRCKLCRRKAEAADDASDKETSIKPPPSKEEVMGNKQSGMVRQPSVPNKYTPNTSANQQDMRIEPAYGELGQEGEVDYENHTSTLIPLSIINETENENTMYQQRHNSDPQEEEQVYENHNQAASDDEGQEEYVRMDGNASAMVQVQPRQQQPRQQQPLVKHGDLVSQLSVIAKNRQIQKQVLANNLTDDVDEDDEKDYEAPDQCLVDEDEPIYQNHASPARLY